MFAASFPPLDIGAAAWLAFVPLLLASFRQSAGRALLFGWSAGTVGGSLLVSPSISTAALRYFADSPWIDMAFALIAPQFYGAIYFALFAWVASRLDPWRRPLVGVAILSSAWVLTEYARSTVWHGCPWALLGHSQHRHLWVVQMCDITGTAGIAFVIMAVNGAVAVSIEWVRQGWRPAPRLFAAIAGTAAVLAAVLLYGHLQLSQWDRVTGAQVKVLAVQGDIPAHWRVSPAGNARALRKLEKLTLRAPAAEADLVIWPENAVGFAVTGNELHFERVTDALQPQSRLLVGAPRAVTDADGRVRLRNSAFLLAPKTGVVATYDKIRLTPYAEYSPLASLPLLRSRYASAARYSPGEGPVLFEVGGHHFGTMICFEAIYPDLARALVAAGATFLVNISNDDWFGGRAAVRQHFVAALFRSIETRRVLVRATNSGITAIVNPAGRVTVMLEHDRAERLFAGITPVSVPTFYARHGEVFTAACVAFLLFVAGFGRVCRRP